MTDRPQPTSPNEAPPLRSIAELQETYCRALALAALTKPTEYFDE